MQASEWDPVLDWFNSRFEVVLEPCSGILGVELPLQTRETMRRYLLSYDLWSAIGTVELHPTKNVELKMPKMAFGESL